MKKFFIILGLLVGHLAWAGNTEVTGKWKTIDDESQKPKSIVEISKVDDRFEGRVIKLFRGPTEEQNPLCDQCKGTLQGTPIIGLKILDGLKPRKSDWGDGTILDPNNGKLYDVKMQLMDEGSRLKVRGFIGFSLLGRTQIWERVPETTVSTP